MNWADRHYEVKKFKGRLAPKITTESLYWTHACEYLPASDPVTKDGFIYRCTYIYIHTYMYTCVYIYIYTYTHMNMYIHMYTYIYIYTYVYIHTHLHLTSWKKMDWAPLWICCTHPAKVWQGRQTTRYLAKHLKKLVLPKLLCTMAKGKLRGRIDQKSAL